MKPPLGEAARSLLIVNARLVNGSGAPARMADVRIDGDRIDAVGQLAPRAGETVLDAAGHVLAPGFIDPHSHHDIGLMEQPGALAAVSQGVTTIVVGQDGGSNLPLRDFLAQFKAAPSALNLASFTGHNSLRERVMGDDFKRPASAAETEAMRRLLAEDMAAGSLGLSTGLEYEPGVYSAKEEVVALARETKRHGGMYISHIRSEDRALWQALDEIVAIGRETGVAVHVSHMKLAMVDWWRQADRFTGVLDAARAEGIDVTGDIYPYQYWQSSAAILFPERDFDNRPDAEFALSNLVLPQDMIVSAYEPDASLVGKTLAEIAAMRNTDPPSTLMALARPPAANIIAKSMDAADIAALVAWPHASICSDGSLDDRHPRGAGSFPRALRLYVREQKLLTIEAAVHKMTGLTAASLGLPNRGVIAPGGYADLVLFDPARVADRASFDDPAATAVGIMKVWTNGQLVYDGEQPTGARPGMVIRRAERD